MNETKNEIKTKKSFSGLRRAARITGSVWVVFILVVNVGYLLDGYINNGNQFATPDDYLAVATLVSLYIGLAGLIIAFWKTLPGIILSSIGFLGAGLFLLIDPKLNFNLIALIVIFIPTILYIGYWLEVRAQAKK